jgi:hypothetical protein
MRAVHPRPDKLLARRGFGLSDFVLVMWEFQIETAAMDIDVTVLFFKKRVDHDAAFGMPAWSTIAPRGIPFDTFLGLFP